MKSLLMGKGNADSAYLAISSQKKRSEQDNSKENLPSYIWLESKEYEKKWRKTAFV